MTFLTSMSKRESAFLNLFLRESLEQGVDHKPGLLLSVSDSDIVSLDGLMCLNFGAPILRSTGQSDLPFIPPSKVVSNVNQNLGPCTYEEIRLIRACFV